MANELQQFLKPTTSQVPIESTNLSTGANELASLLLPPQDISTPQTQREYSEEYANSWGNRFAIGVDNTQASLFKGLDLIADITESEGLKKYA